MKAKLIVREKRAVQGGGFAETVIWEVPQPVPPSAHTYKYRLVYVVDGVRVVGFDNERGKGDHYHVGDKQFPYIFRGISALLSEFDSEIKRWSDGHRHS